MNTSPPSRRIWTIGAAAALLVGSACSEEQRRDIEGGAIRSVIEDATEDALDDEGIGIDDLDCEADIDDDGIVTGSCDGTTDDGDDIETELLGTVDVDEAECDAILTVTVADDLIDERDGFDCLDGESELFIVEGDSAGGSATLVGFPTR
jgi:hypothetical protein